MSILQVICCFCFYFGFGIAAVLASTGGIAGGPGNTTFTVSLVAQGAPACITLTFNSKSACQSYFLTAHYSNCSYTPQVCQVYQPTFVLLTICSAKTGGNCTINVPTADAVAPGAGLCVPAAIGQPADIHRRRSPGRQRQRGGRDHVAVRVERAVHSSGRHHSGLVELGRPVRLLHALPRRQRQPVHCVGDLANGQRRRDQQQFRLVPDRGPPRCAVHVVHRRLGQRQLQLNERERHSSQRRVKSGEARKLAFGKWAPSPGLSDSTGGALRRALAESTVISLIHFESSRP
jgi:hypothetical protein